MTSPYFLASAMAFLDQAPGGAALDEQNLVVVGNAHQLAQIGLGLVDDLLEHLGAVAHLHDAHTAAAVVHHLVADLLQHRLRHHGGAGGEIESTTVFHVVVLLFMFVMLARGIRADNWYL